MSVISCKPNHKKRRSYIKDGKVQHVLSFIVICDDVNDGTVVAIQAQGLPQQGDVILSDNSGAVCDQIEANPVDQGGMKEFEVLCTFSTGDLNASLYPLDRPPTFSFPGQNQAQPYFIDFSTNGPNGGGVPVVNSAGDTFETLPERDVAQLQIEMTRNEAVWDIIAMDQIANTSNAGVVFLDGQAYDVGTLRLGLPTAVKTTEVWQGIPVTYYRISYNFHASHQGYTYDNILDVGYNQLIDLPAANPPTQQDPDANPTGRVPIVDSANMKVMKPWPLDGQGHAKQSATDTPATLQFVKYPQADWSSLRLA